ncbi:MAG: cupin domain-containing protein [Alphaproteobacteria bacterium]
MNLATPDLKQAKVKDPAAEAAAEAVSILAAGVAKDGFAGPVRLLSKRQAHWLGDHLHKVRHIHPPEWHKARAVIDPAIARIARDSAIVDRLKPMLGDDIILWGAHGVTLPPNKGHPWHVDIESATANGPTISVWIGLKNAGPDTGLTVIPGSHRYERLLQQCAADAGIAYDDVSDVNIRRFAQDLDQNPEMLTPEIADGEALFFDGRLWHRSRNSLRTRWRHALLLQYAPAEVAIRIPDLDHLEWPFQMRQAPLPPSILVSGRSTGVNNRIVPAPDPVDRELDALSTVIHPYDLPLAEDPGQGWKPYHAFHGETASLDLLGCHVSVLSPGQCPHPPHAHADEEILIVLEGEADIVIATSPEDPSPRVERLKKHQFSYYPAGQHHTIRNPGDRPVTYMMLRWAGSASGARWPLETQTIDAEANPPRALSDGLAVRTLLDEPTGILSKLHVHLSEMAPRGGYEPHIDAYDMAIVVLEGEIEMMGNTVAPYGLILLSGGQPHAIRNPGAAPARYLVFELHRNTAFMQDKPPLIRKALRQKARARRFAGRVLRKLKMR